MLFAVSMLIASRTKLSELEGRVEALSAQLNELKMEKGVRRPMPKPLLLARVTSSDSPARRRMPQPAGSSTRLTRTATTS